MAKQTLVQKVDACVRLGLGMRRADVAAALRPYGFSPQVLVDGGARVLAIMTACAPELDAAEPVLIRAVDEFEDTWFPIARSVLAVRYPGIERAVFEGLRQDRGAASILTVGAFLERLSAAQSGAYGEDGPMALELLEARGLTAQERERGRSLVDGLTLVSDRTAAVAAYEAEQRRALEWAWAWYIEWSSIARVAIKNKTLLFSLGLRARKAAQATEPSPTDPPLLGAAPVRLLTSGMAH